MTKRIRRLVAVAALGLFAMLAGTGSAHATDANCKLDTDASTLGKVKAAVSCTITTAQEAVFN